MKFSELDNKMRKFETSSDSCVLPGMFMVARLDGRNFTRLTKDIYGFRVPYDVDFREYMINTTMHLMQCGFRVVYGYTQSDEISLLFNIDEDSFGRKLRKLNSVLAGEASAYFSTAIGSIGVFDCRISQLPNIDLVVDYFRWRSEDATRNALNSYCYWTLREQGYSPNKASSRLKGLSVSDKNELLFKDADINFNELPNWQKRGVGLYWEGFIKEAINPLIGKPVIATRKRIKVDLDLPMKDEYNEFVRNLVV